MTNLQCEIMAIAFLTASLMGAYALPLIRRKARMEAEKEAQQRRIKKAYDIASGLIEGAPTRFEKHEGGF